jgi:hypothetical protein
MFQEILMKLSPCVLCLLGAATSLFAAPTISSVANAASNNTFNAPVAQGAVFVIKGSGLGPANIAVSSAPFQNSLAGQGRCGGAEPIHPHYLRRRRMIG